MTLSNRKPVPTAASNADAGQPAAPVVSPRRAAARKTKAALMPAAASFTAQKDQKGQHDERRVRTSFALPESQVAALGELKKRCLGFGVNAKKGELLTAGLQVLQQLSDTALEAAVLPSLRSGRRPAREKKRKK
jgi:hypothetical protein